MQLESLQLWLLGQEIIIRLMVGSSLFFSPHFYLFLTSFFIDGDKNGGGEKKAKMGICPLATLREERPSLAEIRVRKICWPVLTKAFSAI